MSNRPNPRLYSEFANWFHLLTAPEDYAEEAEFYRNALYSACAQLPGTLLELGSGGGNNASHLKAHFELTLVDLSPQMLAISQKLNPGCEHILGDMRTIRLGRTFDAVFVHDAIGYMTDEIDLGKVMETAYQHCRPGGAALFAPDHVLENFKPSTEHGGHDSQTQGLRYLDWTWNPDSDDTTYISDMVYMIKDEQGNIQVEHDRHILGLFPRARWISLLNAAGFQAQVIPFAHSEIEPGTSEVFTGRKKK
jgi:SAM-dependent methyltransferase